MFFPRQKRNPLIWPHRVRPLRTAFILLLMGHIAVPFARTEDDHAASAAGPVLAFRQERLDVGTVPVSTLTPFREDIEFVNRGDQPLILAHVRGCCGTRITQWPQEPIMPGDTGRIEVQFRLAPRPHTVRRTVTVTSNATTPSHVHPIVGQVVPDEAVQEVQTLGPKLVFTKTLLDMGVVTPEQEGTSNARICFENHGDEALTIARVHGTGGMEIKTWPTDPVLPGEASAIELQILPADEQRTFSRNVFIFSNDKVRRHTYRVVGQWATP